MVELKKCHIVSADGYCIPEEYVNKLEGIILPNGLMEDRCEKMAYDISLDYQNTRPYLLCTLKGAHTFFSTLIGFLRQYRISFDYAFIKVKSYNGSQSSGKVRVNGIDLDELKGRDVIIVEDIIDTGRTMSTLVPQIKEGGAASCRTCVFCEKVTPLSNGFKSDYCGFTVPNYFVVGNGFDFDEVMREMAHTGCLSPYGIAYYTEHKLFKDRKSVV